MVCCVGYCVVAVVSLYCWLDGGVVYCVADFAIFLVVFVACYDLLAVFDLCCGCWAFVSFGLRGYWLCVWGGDLILVGVLRLFLVVVAVHGCCGCLSFCCLGGCFYLCVCCLCLV